MNRSRCLLPVSLFLAGTLFFLGGCQTIPSASKREIRSVLADYREALNSHSAEKLALLLAEQITVDGMTDELSRAGLASGMFWPPSRITGLQILSLSCKAGGTEAITALSISKGVLLMRIGFDEKFRIRTIDPVPLWKTAAPKAPPAFSSTFTGSRGLLFVRARLNDRDGFFLLDTGSSDFLLNKKYFSPDSVKEMPGVTATVHGIKPHLGRAAIHSFQWEKLRLKDLRGQLHDFSFMETPAVSPLLGAIGFEQLKKCAVLFDWEHRKILVRPAGEKGPAARPQTVIPFTFFQHVPAFPVRIGNRNLPMIFDSGAQINLLPRLEGLENHFREIPAVTRISDGGLLGKETARLGVVDEIQLGAMRFQDLPFAVFDVPYLSGHGILGSPLLEAGPVEINFVQKTLSVW